MSARTSRGGRIWRLALKNPVEGAKVVDIGSKTRRDLGEPIGKKKLVRLETAKGFA